MLTDNLSYAAMGHSAQGKFEQAVAEAQQAIELSSKIGSLWGEAFGRMWIGPSLLELGRPDRAMATMQEALQLARPSGFIGPLGVAQADLGRLYGQFGQIERGVELARRAFEMSPIPSSAPGAYSAGCLAFLLTLQGDLVDAHQVIALVEQGLDPDSIKLRMTIELRLAEGELALAEHDARRALNVLDELISTQSRLELRALLPMALHGKARALVALGRVQEAESALGQAQDEALRLGARWSLWQILALLADVIEPRAAEDAGNLRRQARAIVDDIASHTPDELRTSFLNISAVTRLRGEQVIE